MKAASTNGKYQIMAEINMIPLIDVSLVLLIIFMVMTPFLVKAQIKITPPSAQGTVVPSDQRNIEIQIDKEGVIYVDGRPVAEQALESTVRGKVTDPKTQSVVILADKDVVFDRVVAVMEVARKLELRSLGVGVRQKNDSKPVITPVHPSR